MPLCYIQQTLFDMAESHAVAGKPYDAACSFPTPSDSLVIISLHVPKH